MYKLLLCVLCLLPLNSSRANILPDADGRDDHEAILKHIENAAKLGGLVSVEQHTGRLLFNPNLAQLQNMNTKQKFSLPALVVNQSKGLKLISQVPLSCFMVSSQELSGEGLKGYRQHQTLQYLSDVKGITVSKALICELVGSRDVHSWKEALDLDNEVDPFIFEAHTSNCGEKFYYYLNDSGAFEMYL